MNFFIHTFFAALLLISLSFIGAESRQEPDLDALAEFCGKESNRQYCEQIAQLAADNARVSQITMEKRKPSFVRFGKRSAPSAYEYGSESEFSSDMGQPMEKRKPSFVRFGRK